MPVPFTPEDEEYIDRFVSGLDALTDEQLDAIADVLAIMRIAAVKADQ